MKIYFVKIKRFENLLFGEWHFFLYMSNSYKMFRS